MSLQPVTPIIVRVIEQPTRETTVADILIQVLGLTGAFVLLTAVAGLLAGGLLIAIRALRSSYGLDTQSGDQLRLGLGS